jgi:hypothetical protein
MVLCSVLYVFTPVDTTVVLIAICLLLINATSIIFAVTGIFCAI